MKIKNKLIIGLLGAAVLAIPMTMPAMAQTPVNPNYVHRVDWWWNKYKNNHDEYVNHGWHKGNYQYNGHQYACERARDLQSQVWNDRRTGHPGAAKTVAREAAAARASCYGR
ncbi:MAG: hypothetical protein ABSD31_08685 [Candidatus Binataceae bacterium]|jgi:hypothetical protein